MCVCVCVYFQILFHLKKKLCVFWLHWVFVATLPLMWDLNSLTRDLTHTPCIGRQVLHHWATREVPHILFHYYKMSLEYSSLGCTLDPYCLICFRYSSMFLSTPLS